MAGRVLVISLADHVGGAEVSMLTLLEALPAVGWTPILLCLPGPLAEAARQRSIEVEQARLHLVPPVSVTSARGKRYSVAAAAVAVLASVRNGVTLAQAARRHRAAVLISNSTSGHLLALLGGALIRTPVVWHLRDIVSPGPGRRLLDVAAHRAAGVIALSKAVADTVPQGRAVVIPNPVAPPGRPLPVPVRRPVVGYLGRLDPGKGLETLVRAIAQTSLELRLAGEARYAPAGYADDIRQLADELAPGRINFLGAQEPWTFLSSVSVLAVPSEMEPFGRVAAEAAVAGIPVVAADSGGLPEIVLHERTGLLCRPGDADAWAAALSRVLGDEDFWSGLGRQARAAADRFEPALHAHRVSEVLDRACSQDVRVPRSGW